MKKQSLSAMWSVIPFALACFVFICVFPMHVVTVFIIVSYCVLMGLSWKNSEKARQLQTNPYSYKGTKGRILKIALCISSPFWFCQFLLALFPVQHYSIWLLFFIPTMFVFALPLSVVADFCKDFRLSRKLFWGLQFLIQASCIGVGRIFAALLLRRFG